MPIIEKKTYRYEPLETKAETEAKFNTPAWKAISENIHLDLDQINKELMAVAESQKEKVLPILPECRKCGNPVAEGESLCGWCT